MKKFIKHALSKEELSKTKGGITEAEFQEVIKHLAKYNPDQLELLEKTYSYFGHGGTVELQFEDA